MDLEIDASGHVGILRVDGELTLQKREELRSALIGGIGAVDHMVISLEEFPDTDVSCLQLICSAHRTFMRMHKRLMLTGRNLQELRNSLMDAGLCIGKCTSSCDGSCVWIEESGKCIGNRGASS
ncbi:MAG: STAS domain-containing protein [Nitrospiraceae bacterium]|nr:STAS domain-containing protein [Nitrospiraceae bacterium]